MNWSANIIATCHWPVSKRFSMNMLQNRFEKSNEESKSNVIKKKYLVTAFKWIHAKSGQDYINLLLWMTVPAI